MQIRNTNQVITNNGNTSDIINTVMWAYDNEADPQIKQLAEKLRGNSVSQTCRNIWQYLIDNVTYKADAQGNSGEMIRTPARLLVDGQGDCKSYSLFTAVILRWLDIPHVIRFVSYSSSKEATHVYVVAFDNSKLSTVNSELIIDAVSAVQLGTPFNHEIKYTYHCDMANGKTRISYLAGFGNPKATTNKKRVGAIDRDRYRVWVGDESQSTITPGKHFLYSLLDLNIEMYNISRTAKDQLFYLDALDVIASLIHAYNVVGGDTAEFQAISRVICSLAYEGRFKSKTLDVEARYDNLDDLYVIIEEHYNVGYFSNGIDAELWNMINTEVLPHNELVNDGISGIHGSETEFVSKLKESGIYYIYKFIPNSDLSSIPAVVREKLQKQTTTFNWMASVNNITTPSGAQNYIRSGIVARTGRTPEQLISDLKNGKEVVSIGEPITLTIIAVISIITGLIKLIQAIWPPKEKQDKPSDEYIKGGAFDPNSDFSKGSTGSGSTSSFGGIALPLAIGAGVLYGMFKPGKK